MQARAALKLNPRSANAYNNLAAALGVQRQLGAATDAYRSALSLQPADGMLYFRLGSVEAQQGEAARGRALQSLRHAARMLPAFAQAYFNLGRVHAAAGDEGQAKAEAQFRVAHALDPVAMEARGIRVEEERAGVDDA